MARCIDCNTEISRSFIRCYPCNRRHKNTPMTTTPPPPPDDRKRPSYRDKAPRDWNYDDRTAGPVIIHEIEPTLPSPRNAARRRIVERATSRRYWPKKGIDRTDKSE